MVLGRVGLGMVAISSLFEYLTNCIALDWPISWFSVRSGHADPGLLKPDVSEIQAQIDS